MQKLNIYELRTFRDHHKILANELLSNPTGVDAEYLLEQGSQLIKEFREAFNDMTNEEKRTLRNHREFMPLMKELIQLTEVLSVGLENRDKLITNK